ncbi:MAG: carboxypeptidase-like regulatory domain-containing protein [Bacteroidales bacterium]|nr:carboxypeptidase-like regulatory domain-containing protein [Bacteroidales bacterium]
MKKSRFSNLTLLIIGLISFYGFCQEIQLSGSIKDTLNNPLENANILAIPFSEDGDAIIKFSITNSKGDYTLTLESNINYQVELSYIGYQKITDSVNISQNTVKNYNLITTNQFLDEVIIIERIPVKIREDTITYRVDKFTNGNEKKLRDVLKKLPGIKIDREGNVSINGKDVTKLLVDGNEFFTGDEKLGVNNIPADIIDEIEALDNYNEVSADMILKAAKSIFRQENSNTIYYKTKK